MRNINQIFNNSHTPKLFLHSNPNTGSPEYSNLQVCAKQMALAYQLKSLQPLRQHLDLFHLPYHRTNQRTFVRFLHYYLV